MRCLAVMFVVASVVVTACSGPSGPQLRWSDYERNCGGNTDCTPIAVADGCVCPLCDNRGINLNSLTQYNKDRATYEAACSATPCSNTTCPAVTPYCDNGTCQVR